MMALADTARQLPRLAFATFARLSQRERRLVVLFAVLLVVSALYVGAIEPVMSGRERLEQRIMTLTADIEVLRQSAGRINELERSRDRATKAEKPAADFSLFSFVDKAASASVTPGSVAAMNPSRRRVRDGEEESLVEVRLSTVPLAEVVAFLRMIEGASEPVFVRRVELKRRYDDRSRFDATVVAAMLETP